MATDDFAMNLCVQKGCDSHRSSCKGVLTRGKTGRGKDQGELASGLDLGGLCPRVSWIRVRVPCRLRSTVMSFRGKEPLSRSPPTGS